MSIDRHAAPDRQAEGAKAPAKTMMYMMPLMTLWMGYILPAALCIYWIANTAFSLIQEVALNKYFNKILDREETEKEKAAREKRYAKYQTPEGTHGPAAAGTCGGKQAASPSPEKKKQSGEEKHSRHQRKRTRGPAALCHVAVPMTKSHYNDD